VTAAQSLPLSQQYGDGSPAAQAGKQQMFISPTIEVNYYAMNTAHGVVEPLVRQAVNYAIDRTGMTKQLGYRPASRPTSTCRRCRVRRSRGRVPADA
jgi:ABC-type transport system substrate-binding protein